jgi:copper chaperone
MARTVNLKVSGMTCGGCVAAVENALKNVTGVDSVAVDLQAGTAKVDLAGDNIDTSQLVVAVKLAGYDAQAM